MKTAKEQGYVLAIDQASNNAGASLWLDGEYVAGVLLSSASKLDSFPVRMQAIVAQLELWLESVLPPDYYIEKIIFEGVRSRLVLCTVGAFCTIPRIRGHVKQDKNFIETTTWKSWAKRHGATGALKDIKGVKALREVGFPLSRNPITSDDIADSCLLYLTWASL